MAPFRPIHLNKRSYPGNGSVIGPTTIPTVGVTTTQCSVCNCTLCGSASLTYTLGCRCLPTSYACCHCCCCCACTVCDRTVPSGMWKSSEQWEARTRDAWGDDTCITGPEIGFCANSGTITGGTTDCKGFLICGTNWFVAPSCTQLGTSWWCRDDAVTLANTCMGSCGWFVPNCSQLQNPGYSCRGYWDTYAGTWYWSSTDSGVGGRTVCFNNGALGNGVKHRNYCVRAFRS